MRKVTFISMCLLLVASVAHADWAPNYKMHWPQLPDLSPTGVDIENTMVTLADDFMCIETGPILDIHIWASFYDDILPKDGVDSLSFALAIHADNPDPPDDWSVPKDPWEWQQDFGPGQYTVSLVADNIWEDWYDPETLEYRDNNHQKAYQYNFYVTADPFVQEEGQIYWLAVKVTQPDDDNFRFGWKTTKARDPDLRWNDDAVYELLAPGAVPVGNWIKLEYPYPHEYWGETLDLAFVITPEPATICLFGLGGLALLRKKR